MVFERRRHANITKKLLKLKYYFSEWDYCRNCKHLQHYECYKVWNDPNVAVLREEEQGKLDFINQI